MLKLRTVAVAVIAMLTCAAVLAPGAAVGKKKKNRAKVTIKVNGGDFSGRVKHKKDGCIAERDVIVFLQGGNSPDPATDTEFASDTTDEDGEWNTGNTGANDGRYYAYAPASPGCKALTSKTVRVTGRPLEEE